MRSLSQWPALIIAFALLQWPQAIAAQESRFELGLRGVVLLGKGTPANDMMGEGLIGRFAVSAPWHLGVALDSVKFDYETPNRTLGIPATAVVDGTNELAPHQRARRAPLTTASGAGAGIGSPASATPTSSPSRTSRASAGTAAHSTSRRPRTTSCTYSRAEAHIARSNDAGYSIRR